jgi:uncharacterized protein YndB with AHSA1/START domain
MKRLEFKILINATPQVVWNTLWDAQLYSQWTKAFCEGSYYKTDHFAEGARVHFLAPDGQGMYSNLEKLEPNTYIEFRHQGDIKNYEELPVSDDWTNAIESYLLTPKDGGTELKVSVDVIESYLDWMNKTFPLAIQNVKDIAEQAS